MGSDLADRSPLAANTKVIRQSEHDSNPKSRLGFPIITKGSSMKYIVLPMLLLIVPSECFGQTVSGSTYTVTGANGVLTAGPGSPTAGSTAQVDWDWRQGSTDISTIGGFFSDKVYIGQGWSRTFTSSDTGNGNAGSAATWSLAVNNGSPQQVVGNMAWGWAQTSNSVVFGPT